MPTKIEWCNDTWNWMSGCTPVSTGCENCYARRMAQRLRGRFGYPADDPFKVTIHEDKMHKPLGWKKPRIIFPCSMGDMFHKDVPAQRIIEAFEIMSACKQHTFIVLTKRADRLYPVLYGEEGGFYLGGGDYLSNVWLGVTAENQECLDKRVPYLMKIKEASCGGFTILISVEPILGPIQLLSTLIWGGPVPMSHQLICSCGWSGKAELLEKDDKDYLHCPSCNETNLFSSKYTLDWVICGCETGPGARSMDINWVRQLRDQCIHERTPFFLKKLHSRGGSTVGRMLDGRLWEQFPKNKKAHHGGRPSAERVDSSKW